MRYVTAVKMADIYNFKSSFKYCKRVSFKPILSFYILYPLYTVLGTCIEKD